MFLYKSMRSKRKKKSKETSERKKKTSIPAAGQKKEESKRNKTKASKETADGVSRAVPAPPPKNDFPGEAVAKKWMTAPTLTLDAISKEFGQVSSAKPAAAKCPRFQANLPKSRATDCPIADDKLVKLSHAPEGFICAAKLTVPEFKRTALVAQVPDVTKAPMLEDFWRMIFQEEIVSIVLAVMPMECQVSLQQLLPIANGTFANHGKMFLNNKKVESSVGMTAYTLELLPDGCSNSVNTTVYHLLNWKQKKGADNIGELVNTIEKVVKLNENVAFVSMNGTGRAGTMLCVFAGMQLINKSVDVKMKEILEKLRAERSGLVENAEQYVAVHKAIATWIKTKSKDELIAKKAKELGV
ncbi:unnamed protein product [Caenorhabditis sp. 36 PRJEB53466]|nr:unnamed protein product [Caenorhabditis sp. 36 PRJEB53466]